MDYCDRFPIILFDIALNTYTEEYILTRLPNQQVLNELYGEKKYQHVDR